MKWQSTRVRSPLSRSAEALANGIAILASGFAVVAGVKALARRAAQRPSRAGWLVLTLFVVGCSSPLGPEQDSLASARARWNALSLDGYTYQFRRACFCPPEFVREMRIEVLGDVVNSAIYVDTSEPVTLPEADIPTIDDLLAEIQAAIDSEAFLVVATYDQTQGFPTSVSIDFIEMAIDDEMAFTVTAFQPIDTSS